MTYHRRNGSRRKGSRRNESNHLFIRVKATLTQNVFIWVYSVRFILDLCRFVRNWVVWFYSRSVRGSGRLGPGRFGPIFGVGRFGPSFKGGSILGVSRFDLIHLFWENR